MMVIMIYLQFISIVTELLFVTVVTSVTTSLIEQNLLDHMFCHMLSVTRYQTEFHVEVI